MIRRKSSVRLVLDNLILFSFEAVADEYKVNYILRLLMVKIRVESRIVLGLCGGELTVLENSALNHINIAVCSLRNVEISCYDNGAVVLCGELIDKSHAVLSRFLAPVVEVGIHRDKFFSAFLVEKFRPRCDSSAGGVP